MKNRALLSAVALCFLVAGCESKKEEPAKPKVADKVIPVPAAAPTAPPASADQDAKPMKMADTKAAASAIPPGLKGCKKNRCDVTLTVTGSGDPDCKITASPNPRGVHKDNKGDHIKWTIATAGWEFDANGIDFGGDPQFSGGQLNGANNKYRWTDANTDPAPTQHDYRMNLKNPKTGKKCTKDPSIVNGVLVED
jgi:hypothetical protein